MFMVEPELKTILAGAAFFALRLGKTYQNPVCRNVVNARGLSTGRTMKWSNAMGLTGIPLRFSNILR